jgi:hypothetical protein
VCGQEKPLSDFPKRMQVHRYKGHVPWCRACESERFHYYQHRDRLSYIKRTLRNTRARCKRNNIKFDEDLTTEFLNNLYEQQNGKCAISGLPLTWMFDEGHSNGGDRRGTNLSIDRLDPTGHYSTKNVRLVCDRANKIKSNLQEVDLYFWCDQIASNYKGK